MRFLAIETSSDRGSLALLENDRLVQEVFFSKGLVHGREIVAHAEELLGGAGCRPSDLGGVAVSIGPGSYTGLRVGVTTAKTLGFALGIPVEAVSSLEVLAATVLETAAERTEPARGMKGSDRRPVSDDLPRKLLTLLDGRRGFLYVARFSPASRDVQGFGKRPLRDLADRVARADEVMPLVEAGTWVCGEGSRVLRDALEADSIRSEGVRIIEDGSGDVSVPSARVLGKLALDGLLRSSFDRETIHRLQPAYLRPSEPEIVWASRQQEMREVARGDEGEKPPPSFTSGGDRGGGQRKK